MFSQQLIDAVSADGSAIGYAVEIFFPDEVSRTHTGVGNILINGQIFYGVGELGEVGIIESVGDENPIELSLELSGLSQDLLADALQAQARGQNVVLYVIVFDSNTGQLILAESALNGFITNYSVVAGNNNTIQMTVADEFMRFEMPWNSFWTDESHKSDQSNDRICRYTSQMEEREIQWGSKNDAPPFVYQ